MKNQIFLPEARCKLTNLDVSVDPSCHIGKVVNVLVNYYDYSKQEMHVLFGNSFCGIIPLNELSIYESKKPLNKFLSPFFKNSRILTAKIIYFDSETNCFLLSRKESMKDALSYFSVFEGTDKIFFAYKTGFSDSNVFVDIGAGIHGVVSYKEVSDSFVSQNYFEGIDYIPVNILFQNVYGKFILSHKSAVPCQQFNVGDLVTGRIIHSVATGDGLFVELNPNQSGILDIDTGLLTTQHDGVKIFIIPAEHNFFPAYALEENKNYLFSIRGIKDNKHFKLSLV